MIASASPTEPRPPARREVVLVLEPDDASHAAIALALDLARHFAANLVALLIEDEALLRAARLPFAFEISRHSGEERRLDPLLLERRLRRAVGRLRDALLPQVQGMDVDVRSVRSPAHMVLADYGTADVVIFGCTPAMRRSAGNALPLRLESADADVARFDEVMQALHSHTAAAPWERLLWTGDAELLARLRRRHPSLVLINRGDPSTTERLQSLIEALDCPLVVLR